MSRRDVYFSSDHRKVSPELVEIEYVKSANESRLDLANKLCSARESYQGLPARAQSQRNDRPYNMHENYEGSPKTRLPCNGRPYDVHESYISGGPAQPQASRCNGGGYVSTDESEYTTDESESEADDDYEDAGSLERGDSAPSALLNYCDREYSVAYDNEYVGRRRSATSQELEVLCANGDPRFVNTEAETPAEAKSLMLSMLASQEDILETKKHLRNTPVLDNLLGTATPECKLADVNPELGKLTRMRFVNVLTIFFSIDFLLRPTTLPSCFDKA